MSGIVFGNLKFISEQCRLDMDARLNYASAVVMSSSDENSDERDREDGNDDILADPSR